MIKILVFTHGELGAEMLKTAESIIGAQAEAYVFPKELEDGLVGVSKQVGQIIDKIKNDDGILILTDMAGGTPTNASLPFSRNEKVEIVTGMNLYMLISAFMNREVLPLRELAGKITEDAKKNITNAGEIFLNKFKG